MQDFYSPLPHVPFTVPIPGMTFEEYCHYLSWRIYIQILAMQLADETTPKSRIIEHLMDINRKAQCLPVQPLPDDLRTIALELTDPNSQPGILSMPMLIDKLWRVFT